MQSFQEIEYLLFGLSIIALLVGAVVLLIYNLPKVRNAEDLFTVLPLEEWTPEKFKTYEKYDLISRLGVTFVLTGTFFLLLMPGIHMLIS